MGMIWDPALREREGEESVTAVPAFSRSLNGALEDPWGSERVGGCLPSPTAQGLDSAIRMKQPHGSSSAPASRRSPSPGGALPFVAVLDAVRTRP